METGEIRGLVLLVKGNARNVMPQVRSIGVVVTSEGSGQEANSVCFR